MKSAPVRIWIKGNVEITEFVWTAILSGEKFRGVKGTHKPVGAPRLQIAWFNDDGLIKKIHEYGDDESILYQGTGKKGAPPLPVFPANGPTVYVAKGSPDEEKLVEWAKSTYETFSKNDVKAVLDISSSKFIARTNMPGSGDVWKWDDVAMASYQSPETAGLIEWFKAFPDQKWTGTNAWGIDGFAILEHTMSGTRSGPLGPLPASNKSFSNWHFVDILQPSAGGKIERAWSYGNTSELLALVGAK